MFDQKFYQGKRVFLTGHTGFKGSWLSKMLIDAGAVLTGYSLAPEQEQCLWNLVELSGSMHSISGDIRDFQKLQQAFRAAEPEIVIHMAAQPIVRTSYEDPVYTYETNVMGTVYLLECIRESDTVRSFVNVTTDKVYKNNEWIWGYRENEPLDGQDPYSNSKSCSELVTHSYQASFFAARKLAVSTARAGNVIGGGDFARDRIVPDCVRSALGNTEIKIRNPHSVRPYQHVLDPLSAYLMIAERQYRDTGYQGYYNVGPDEKDCVTTGELADLFCSKWGAGAAWMSLTEDGPHEANFLKLDCSKLKSTFGWKPKWDIDKAVEKTVEWFRVYQQKGDLARCMEEQIRGFIK